MKCPICDKEVTKRNNLFRHLAGERRYDGHNLPDDQAKKIVEDVFNDIYVESNYWERNSLPDPDNLRTNTENHYEKFFEDYFITLIKNKMLPKYQFERRIDGILQVFLSELLSIYFQEPVEIVVPEFPFKNETNNKSKNADFLLIRRDKISKLVKVWMFLELKTEKYSIEADQILNYKMAMEKGIPRIVKEIERIHEATNYKSKYKELLSRLHKFPVEEQIPIELIYLAPIVPQNIGLETIEHVHTLTFEDLENLSVNQFSEVWKKFCLFIIQYLKGGEI